MASRRVNAQASNLSEKISVNNLAETWKDIPGYEGLYQASTFGRVRSVDRIVPHGAFDTTRPVRGRILKVGTRPGDGRVVVNLSKVGKVRHWKVHRLIAYVFLPNPDDKPQINHIDGDPKNNRLDNLEWATNSENGKHAYKIGLRKPLPHVLARGKEHPRSCPVQMKERATGRVLKVFVSQTEAIAKAEVTHRVLRRHLAGILLEKDTVVWESVENE